MKLDLRSLRRLIREAMNSENRITLRGPFKHVGNDPGNIEYYEGTVRGFSVENDEFNRLAMSNMGLSPEEMASEEPLTEHEFQVEVEWNVEASDRSVGYTGGYSIERWNLLTLDEIELTPEDSAALRGVIGAAVMENEEEWATYAAESQDHEDPNAYDRFHDR